MEVIKTATQQVYLSGEEETLVNRANLALDDDRYPTVRDFIKGEALRRAREIVDAIDKQEVNP